MNIPVLVLLGFAAWTLVILSVGVGGYRWALIFSGRASVAGWRADAPQSADWYQRVMHALAWSGHPSYSAFRRNSWDAGSTSEMVSSDRHRLGTPRVAPCLREARVRGWGESAEFQPLPSRARLAGNDTSHANCRAKNISQRDNFRDALLPLATAARIYRSRGGAAAVGMLLRLRAA